MGNADSMNQGIGRSLFAHAAERARALGFRTMEIESDPNAEGCYKKLRARRVRISVTELDGQRRELPVLVYEILADLGRPDVA
jgi:GNAT superfamily N-acetyltransferase